MKVEVKDEYAPILEKRAKEKGFETVEEYVNSVLEQIVSKLKEEKPVYSKEDEQKVKERLRALGYLD